MRLGKTQWVLMTLIVEWVIFLILAGASYSYIRSDVENDVQSQMLAVARYAAESIDAAILKQVQSPDDEFFARVKKELRHIESTYGLREGLAYVVQMEKNRPVFSIMTNEQPFRGHAYPSEIGFQIRRVFQGQDVVRDLYEDRNGEFISVLVPIRDGGDVIAALEIDFLGQDYRTAVLNRLQPLLGGLALVLLVPFAFIIVITFRLHKTQTREARARDAAHQKELEAIRQREQFEVEVVNKQMEAQRRQAEALDEQRRQFFRMIVHDMKTPLASIQLIMDMMAKEIKDSSVYVDRVKGQFGQLTSLIDDIALLNNLEQHGFTPRREVVDISDVIGKTITGLEEAARTKGLRFKALLRPMTLEGDSALFRRLLSNLLSNAVRYSSSNSEIQVAVASINDEIIVKVSNASLRPVDQETLKKMFQPFQRLGETSDILGKSSGMGLSISKAIVEAHGGRIFAESDDGSTVTFVFQVPLRTPSRQRHVA
jgi:signal transduction histidine kinase